MFIWKVSARGDLFRALIGSLGVRIAGAILGLLVSVLLARILNPDGYGVYAYVVAMISILSIPAQVGMPMLVVRETAKSHANEQWGLMRGLWRWSSAMSVGAAVLLIMLAMSVCWFFKNRFTEIEIRTFYYGLLLVPLVALSNIVGAALRGLQRVVLGQLSDAIIRQGVFLMTITIVMLFLSIGWMSTANAMGLNVLATALSLLIGYLFLSYVRPAKVSSKPIPKYEGAQWLSSAIPLAAASGMMLLNQQTDILMLGLFRTAEDVGIYRVVLSIASLVVFGLEAINLVTAPHFARLYSKGEQQDLQKLVTLSARLITLIALPVVLILSLFGDWVLAVIFGSGYSHGYMPMIILAWGQLFNAAIGPVGVLLNMTGHERVVVRGVTVSAVVNVVLNAVLIPLYGTGGAAFATALSIITWNIILWYEVKSRINISSMAF